MNLANTKSGAASMVSGATTAPGLAGPIESLGRQMGPPSEFAGAAMVCGVYQRKPRKMRSGAITRTRNGALFAVI